MLANQGGLHGTLQLHKRPCGKRENPFASHASHHVTKQVKIRCNIYERVKCTGPDSLIHSHEKTGSLDDCYNNDELIGRLSTLS